MNLFRGKLCWLVIDGTTSGEDGEHDDDCSHYATIILVGNVIDSSNAKVFEKTTVSSHHFAIVVEQVLFQTC